MLAANAGLVAVYVALALDRMDLEAFNSLVGCATGAAGNGR